MGRRKTSKIICAIEILIILIYCIFPICSNAYNAKEWEFLICEGENYLDTGIELTGNYKIEMKIRVNERTSEYSKLWGTDSKDYESWIQYKKSNTLYFQSNGKYVQSSIDIQTGGNYIITEEAKGSTISIKFGNRTTAITLCQKGAQSVGTLKLFTGTTNAPGTYVSMSYFRIIIEDETVLDLVPVHSGETIEGKTAIANCFYDYISKEFKYPTNPLSFEDDNCKTVTEGLKYYNTTVYDYFDKYKDSFFKKRDKFFPTDEELEKSPIIGEGRPYIKILRNQKMPFFINPSGEKCLDLSGEYHIREGDDEYYELHKGTAGGTSNSGEIVKGLFPVNDDCYTEIKRNQSELNNECWGMEIEVPFYMTPTGQVINLGTKQMEDMIFEIQGNKDIWIYIDEHLILDLSGANVNTLGKINFTEMKDIEEGGHVLKIRYATLESEGSTLYTKFNLLDVKEETVSIDFLDDTNSQGTRIKDRNLTFQGVNLNGNNAMIAKANIKINQTQKKSEYTVKLPIFDYQTGEELTYILEEENIKLENGDTYLLQEKISNNNNHYLKYLLQGNKEIEVSCEWKDWNNKAKERPSSVNVIVYRKD